MAKIELNGFDGKIYVDGVPKIDLVNFDDEKSMFYRGMIPTAADLNEYIDTGIYHQNSDTFASAGSNYPLAYSGALSVMSDGVNIFQQYHVNGAAESLWYRSFSDAAWSNWTKLLKSTDIDVISDIAPSTTKAYSSTKTEAFVATSISSTVNARMDAVDVSFNSVFDTIATIDFSKSVPTTGSASINAIIAIDNTGLDYRFMVFYVDGTNTFAVPVSIVSGIKTVGTPVQILSGTGGVSNVIQMSANRLVISLATTFLVLDYSTFLVPTIGSTVAVSTVTGILGLKMIQMDATRVSYVYTTSIPQTYVGCLDIGASGNVITKGTEVSMVNAYNTADVFLYKNVDVDKVDCFIRVSGTTVNAIQYKCTGTVSTVSAVTAVAIGTTVLHPTSFIVVGVGKYLLGANTTTTNLAALTTVFDGTTTLVQPVLTTSNITVSFGTVCTKVMIVKTKATNIYLLIAGDIAVDYSTASHVYGAYNASTYALVASPTKTGLYGYTGQQYSSQFSGLVHYYDMNSSVSDDLVLSNTSRASVIRVTLSPTTGLITYSNVYKNGQLYADGVTVGGFRYIANRATNAWNSAMVYETGGDTSSYSYLWTGGISNWNDLVQYSIDVNSSTMYIWGDTAVPKRISYVMFDSVVNQIKVFGTIKNYILPSIQSSSFLKIIKKK